MGGNIDAGANVAIGGNRNLFANFAPGQFTVSEPLQGRRVPGVSEKAVHAALVMDITLRFIVLLLAGIIILSNLCVRGARPLVRAEQGHL